MITQVEAREIVKNKQKEYATEELRSISKYAADKLLAQAFYKNADIVLCYAATAREVSTFCIIEEVLASGKRLALPKVDGDDIYFVYCLSTMDLACGYRGIWEPMGTDKFTIPNTGNILSITPGIAFDTHRNRVGHGKGYYDKYYAKQGQHRFFKAALAFDFQIFPEIETQPHDIKVDSIITPTQILE